MLFPNPEDIIKEVESMYWLKPGTISSAGRKSTVVQARCVAVNALKALTPLSPAEIGDLINKDTSSITRSLSKIYFDMAAVKALNNITKKFTEKLTLNGN